MKTTKRLGLWCLYTLLLSLAGLLVIVAAVATPAPPRAATKQTEKAEKPKRPPHFPLSLFASAEESDYSNERNCNSCHRTAVETYQRSPHAIFMKDPRLPLNKQGCQACHGPSAPHIAHRKAEEGLYQNVISYSHAKPEEISAACLRCHGDTITESHWRLAAHERAGVTCTSCHQIHSADRLGKDEIHYQTNATVPEGAPATAAPDPVVTSPAPDSLYTEARSPKALLKAEESKLCGQCHRQQVAEFRHNFHHPVPEGRMVCSDCHDVHTNRDDRKRVRTAKQSCITCHAEVAGPFVYEHDPVSDLGGAGCMECHRPHGSSNPRMLKAFSRGLCTQCHTDKAVNHNPGRSCFDSGCHSAVHGSNHDPLLLRR